MGEGNDVDVEEGSGVDIPSDDIGALKSSGLKGGRVL
jgi:hypothetical protein